MRSIADRTGVVFDIRTRDAEQFIECFEQLKATVDARRIDFDVVRAKSLPELSPDEGGR